jgi:hypothetical protein
LARSIVLYIISVIIEFRGKLNYRNLTYGEHPGLDHAPILDQTGELIWRPWLGLISDVAARAKRDARPVRLVFVAYRYINDYQWVDLDKNQQVQGCLVAEGVYGVVERCRPRILPARISKQKANI